MQWIKYQIKQCTIDGEDILTNKKIGYSEANLAIAQTESYNGDYEVVEDGKTYDKEPLPIELGGTGAKIAEDALRNLGAMPKANGTATQPVLKWELSDGGTIELKRTGGESAYYLNLMHTAKDGTKSYHNLISSDVNGYRFELATRLQGEKADNAMPKYSGENVISSINEDTVDFWKSKGTGLFYISKAGVVTNQPAQWGFIVNYADGWRVKQLWFDVPNGVVAQRGGNTNGWNNDGNWTKFIMETGGTFTGNVKAYETARTDRSLFNEETRKSNEKTGTLQKVKYFINVID